MHVAGGFCVRSRIIDYNQGFENLVFQGNICMEINEIKSVDEAVKFNASILKTGVKYIFRGHSCEAFHLIPSIGRKSGKDKERNNFEEFRKLLEKKGYFNQPLMHNDFRILGLAQHVQYFPTRLLDWTSNIFIALYFACENKERHGQDGAIWSFPLPNENDSIWLNPCEENTGSPFSFYEFKLFICGSFVDDFKLSLDENNIQFGHNRDMVQQSVMTLHPKKGDGFKNLEDLSRQYNLKKILITKEYKKSMLDVLAEPPYWICKETLIEGESVQDLKSEEKWREIMARNLIN